MAKRGAELVGNDVRHHRRGCDFADADRGEWGSAEKSRWRCCLRAHNGRVTKIWAGPRLEGENSRSKEAKLGENQSITAVRMSIPRSPQWSNRGFWNKGKEEKEEKREEGGNNRAGYGGGNAPNTPRVMDRGRRRGGKGEEWRKRMFSSSLDVSLFRRIRDVKEGENNRTPQKKARSDTTEQLRPIHPSIHLHATTTTATEGVIGCHEYHYYYYFFPLPSSFLSLPFLHLSGWQRQ